VIQHLRILGFFGRGFDLPHVPVHGGLFPLGQEVEEGHDDQHSAQPDTVQPRPNDVLIVGLSRLDPPDAFADAQHADDDDDENLAQQ